MHSLLSHIVETKTHVPVFYVNLDESLSEEDTSHFTGTITSTIRLEDGAEVLIQDDVLSPLISVIATVFYLETTYEGYVYQYSYESQHVGAASPFHL